MNTIHREGRRRKGGREEERMGERSHKEIERERDGKKNTGERDLVFCRLHGNFVIDDREVERAE